MNKVFIPDNEGGGTWETFTPKARKLPAKLGPWTASGNFTQREADECNTAERDHYKAHAEALAEACRAALILLNAQGPRQNKVIANCGELSGDVSKRLREALANWEAK